MKLFGLRLFEREQKDSREVTLAEIAAAMNGSAKSKAGAAVTWDTALQTTAVLACVRVIAEGLAQVPIKLYRETVNGGREVMRTHAVHRLISRRPNARQTSFEWRETVAMHAALMGDAYNFKVMLGGKVVELLPLPPQRVKKEAKDGLIIAYEYSREDGSVLRIPPDLMWHLRGPTWDTVSGLAPVLLAREAIGLALVAEEHAARSFSNGARPSGVLSTDASLDDEQVKNLRASWNATYTGVSNAFKTAILWGGLKWQAITASNNDTQLAQIRSQQIEEICRAFRVIPLMVGYSDKTATYASAEQMFLAHVTHTLQPWYERMEQSAERALLSDKEQDDGLYIKFVTAGLLRGAHEARANYYSAALGAGGSPAWMTQDEVRALEELNPMGGTAAQLPVITNAPKGPDHATPDV